MHPLKTCFKAIRYYYSAHTCIYTYDELIMQVLTVLVIALDHNCILVPHVSNILYLYSTCITVYAALVLVFQLNDRIGR